MKPVPQLAWVLHYRPYQENSIIAELLTEHSGKITVITRHMKGKKKGNIWQPFTRLYLSWYGNSDLKRIKKTEIDRSFFLERNYLYCGLYINELLTRTLQPQLPIDEIWSLYNRMLYDLQEKKPLEISLRLFEKELLQYLGYGIPLLFEYQNNRPIECNAHYMYDPLSGFTILPHTHDQNQQDSIYPGWLLIRYAQNHIDPIMMPLLKRLNRAALSPLLGTKPLKSRMFFIKNILQQKNITTHL